MAEEKYNPSEIEAKWNKVWMDKEVYKCTEVEAKKKSYVLIEFPYPSGERLHVGHARSYSCLDAVARLRRMKGMNVMFPFGWDAFGLPAENYAIKTGVHPMVTTEKNIANAKLQAISWGLSFDWSREIKTTDPEYYKWTQWIFIQMYKRGLAYKKEIPVNWCPSCKINLANEEVIDGKCERCGTETERRTQSQWLLKITAYADRLLEDLKTVNFREDIAKQQINWIGKKEGAKVKFSVINDQFTVEPLEVFTTRLDTIFGVTFLVMAPEVAKDLSEYVPGRFKRRVTEYVEGALNKSERERSKKTEKTGVNTGLLAINPANGEEIPVWVAEYVMMDVGTGVVMGVPGHDSRDHEFARKYKLPVLEVVEGGVGYEGEGKLINSGKYSGIESGDAREQMIADGLGEKTYHYHLRDWVFSRQHYWGEPIPMVFCEKCGWYPVPEEQLPVKLPEVEKYQPTGTGESPLAHIDSWMNTTCPNCGGPARRETDTMPNWAGSSWYYLRYCDTDNHSQLADRKKLDYWLPVDWYNGGMEHTTLHLLYSRFWHKFLFDIGVVPTLEPYAKRTSHGVVLGPDGRKMSKSRGNVINPDEIVGKFGADTLRMYEMFIGPFDQMVVWSDESMEGVYRFLKRIWLLSLKTMVKGGDVSGPGVMLRVSRLAEKIENDLENMKFNTAVAGLMEFGNWWGDHETEVERDMLQEIIKILAPMAPYLAEELYQRLFNQSVNFNSVHSMAWPVFTAIPKGDELFTVIVQVNGKVRGKIEAGVEANDQVNIVKTALDIDNVSRFINNKQYKTVFVPGKIINFVTE